ncbi:MAG TPA: SAM-dependent methyltransferase [Microthrixaceae bacterium]|nr:SAM-dependent methyltransferase [Microthrixaceae bacterium]
MSSEHRLGAVGATALGIAAIRARESARTDRLFDDPLAGAFVDAVGGRGADWLSLGDVELSEDQAAISHWVVMRTVFIDDCIRQASADGIRQFVTLGSGLDTRPFRLALPSGCVFYEVDTADVVAFKEWCLSELGVREPVTRLPVIADLRGDWLSALVAQGLREEMPIAWVLEGVTIYLTAEENDRLLHAVGRSSSSGSRLALTIARPTTGGPVARSESATPFRWLGPTDVKAWIHAHGWQVVVRSTEEVAADHERPAEEGARRMVGQLVDGRRPAHIG